MPRYEHYLTKSKGNRFPAFVIGLYVDSVPTEASTVRDGVQLRLRTWDAVCYAREKDEYKYKYHAFGTRADDFWTGLEFPLSKGSETLIVCFGASEVWPLMEVWERLENQTVHLLGEECAEERNVSSVSALQTPLGNDTGMAGEQSSSTQLPVLRTAQKGRSHHYGPKRRKSRGVDACSSPIIEDPPSILWCKIPGLKGYMRWVDLKNYGITQQPQSLNGSNTASAIAAQMISLITLLKSQGMGSLKSTAAGQSLFSFRRKYLSASVLCHNNASALKLEEQSYVGGRCECFRIGTIVEPVQHLDFRSMYPACYTGAALPIRLLAVERTWRGTVSDFSSMAGQAIAAVDIETESADYPAKRNGIVIWPVGRFRTTLCGPELEDAIEHDRVTRVHSFATYRMVEALGEYGKELYDERGNAEGRGDKSSAEWIKRLLVAIVGKFGQREKTWVSVPGARSAKPYGYWHVPNQFGGFDRWRAIAWRVQREVIGGFAQDAVPAIASWITSLGRMKLLQSIRCAGAENVLYCDTDAMIVTNCGLSRLQEHGMVQNGTLGKLTLKDSADVCDIFGIKSLRIGTRNVCSGIPQSHERIGENQFLYSRSKKPTEEIRQGVRPTGERINERVHRGAPYLHGVLQESGEVRPIKLWEW